MLNRMSKVRALCNSGAVLCRIIGGYKKRTAFSVGDICKVSILTTESKNDRIKIKKGDISRAIIVSTVNRIFDSQIYTRYGCNGVVLLNDDGTMRGNTVYYVSEHLYKLTGDKIISKIIKAAVVVY